MKARDLMTRDVEVCKLNDSAAEAVDIMTRRNCGFVPIVSNNESRILEAVITDRDVALFLGQTNLCAKDVQVWQFCRFEPKTVTEDADAYDIANLMEVYQIHRVPVVDQIGKLVGVVSLKDLAKEAWLEKGIRYPEMTEAKIGEIIETIATSR